jgi:hypothetical protein
VSNCTALLDIVTLILFGNNSPMNFNGNINNNSNAGINNLLLQKCLKN